MLELDTSMVRFHKSGDLLNKDLIRSVKRCFERPRLLAPMSRSATIELRTSLAHRHALRIEAEQLMSLTEPK